MPKCGTSTLHDVLSQQDGVFVPPVKEINFLARHHLGYQKSLTELLFSKHWAARQDRLAVLRVVKRVLLAQRSPGELAWLARYVFGHRDLDWYASLFPPDRISGDISPSYCLLEPEEIRALRSKRPDLRIIILLRSPLQQIWSHCRMSVVKLGKGDDLAALQANIEELTGYRATYRSLVDDWSSVYGEQVFVGYLEDMAADVRQFFTAILEFLGAPCSPERLPATARSHVGVSFPVPPAARGLLAEHASLRLTGFEAISRERAEAWRAEVETFRRNAGADPGRPGLAADRTGRGGAGQESQPSRKAG